MGNTLAEGVFKDLLKQAGLSGRFQVESSGIGAWYSGKPPDVPA